MRICIVGPVVNTKSFGGVATFDEGLADAFTVLGDEAIIITDFAEKEMTSGGTPIIHFYEHPARKNPVLPFKMEKYIFKQGFDLVISSLEYGLVNLLLKTKRYDGQIMYYLHGYATCQYRWYHMLALVIVQKMIRGYSDYFIANSELTAQVNKNIYNIHTDAIVNLGCGQEYMQALDHYRYVEKKSGTALYVGKLNASKNVDLIIRAFDKSSQLDVLYVIGDGPEKNHLQKLADECSKPVKLLGRKSHAEIIEWYLQAEVFISMNGMEPFGITFLEALAANCKIVAPYTGGQMDVLFRYSDRCFLTRNNDVNTLSLTMDKAATSALDKHEYEYWKKRVGYDHTARDIKKVLDRK